MAETILELFKNYISFYPRPEIVPLETAKLDFLEGEGEEIRRNVRGKNRQDTIYKYVKSVIDKVDEETYKEYIKSWESNKIRRYEDEF